MSRAWPKTALVVLATAALVAGCASVDPQDFNALQAQVARDQARLRDLTKRVDQMQQTIETTRGPQANLVADMAYMRQELARLNGRIDETSQMLNQGGGELGQRLERVESYLGLTPSAGGGPESSPPPMAAPAPTPAPAPA
ncbi:MAG: hypothetical protein LDL11_08445, partial [Desulfarculus sp.]|nr:hypothetical protein [Desulfarculus sp.]